MLRLLNQTTSMQLMAAASAMAVRLHPAPHIVTPNMGQHAAAIHVMASASSAAQSAPTWAPQPAPIMEAAYPFGMSPLRFHSFYRPPAPLAPGLSRPPPPHTAPFGTSPYFEPPLYFFDLPPTAPQPEYAPPGPGLPVPPRVPHEPDTLPAPMDTPPSVPNKPDPLPGLDLPKPATDDHPGMPDLPDVPELSFPDQDFPEGLVPAF